MAKPARKHDSAKLPAPRPMRHTLCYHKAANEPVYRPASELEILKAFFRDMIELGDDERDNIIDFAASRKERLKQEEDRQVYDLVCSSDSKLFVDMQCMYICIHDDAGCFVKNLIARFGYLFMEKLRKLLEEEAGDDTSSNEPESDDPPSTVPQVACRDNSYWGDDDDDDAPQPYHGDHAWDSAGQRFH